MKKGTESGGHIGSGHAAELALDLQFALRARQIRRYRAQLVLWHGREKIVDAGDTDFGQHRSTVGLAMREIAHQPFSFTNAS